MLRISPIFLQVVPAIDVACAVNGDTATDTVCKASGSGAATGSIPTRAAAPAETV